MISLELGGVRAAVGDLCGYLQFFICTLVHLKEASWKCALVKSSGHLDSPLNVQLTLGQVTVLKSSAAPFVSESAFVKAGLCGKACFQAAPVAAATCLPLFFIKQKSV